MRAWVSWFNEDRLHSELGDMTLYRDEDYGHQPQAPVA